MRRILPIAAALLLAQPCPAANRRLPQRKPALRMQAQPATPAPAHAPLTSPPAQRGYAVGQQLAERYAPLAPDVDALRMEPLVREKDPRAPDEATGKQVSAALNARAQARAQGMAVPAWPAGIGAEEVAHVLAMNVTQAIAPVREGVDMGAVFQGLDDALARRAPRLDAEQQRRALADLDAFMRARAAEQAVGNRREGAAFLARNRNAPGVMTTRSGLQYRILREGNGQRPAADSTVRVRYEGRTLDGKVFDASRGGPVEFPLNRVIAGWTEGLQLMTTGGQARFWIPANLAYGTKGSPPMIGPDATLIFDVDLVGVTR